MDLPVVLFELHEIRTHYVEHDVVLSACILDPTVNHNSLLSAEEVQVGMNWIDDQLSKVDKNWKQNTKKSLQEMLGTKGSTPGSKFKNAPNKNPN